MFYFFVVVFEGNYCVIVIFGDCEGEMDMIIKVELCWFMVESVKMKCGEFVVCSFMVNVCNLVFELLLLNVFGGFCVIINDCE